MLESHVMRVLFRLVTGVLALRAGIGESAMTERKFVVLPTDRYRRERRVRALDPHCQAMYPASRPRAERVIAGMTAIN